MRAGTQKCSCAPTDIIKHFRRGTPRLYKDAVGDSDAIGQVLIAALHSIGGQFRRGTPRLYRRGNEGRKDFFAQSVAQLENL